MASVERNSSLPYESFLWPFHFLVSLVGLGLSEVVYWRVFVLFFAEFGNCLLNDLGCISRNSSAHHRCKSFRGNNHYYYIS